MVILRSADALERQQPREVYLLNLDWSRHERSRKGLSSCGWTARLECSSYVSFVPFPPWCHFMETLRPSRVPCRLDVHILDYLKKRKLHETANSFMKECKVSDKARGEALLGLHRTYMPHRASSQSQNVFCSHRSPSWIFV